MAIFYLNDLDHYIKEDLKIKYYIRYQDDFLLFHQSKQYLRECLIKIKEFLKKENLSLNKKSMILTSNNNFIFLGRDKKGKYARYRIANKKLKHRKYLYSHGEINLMEYSTSILTYR